MSCIDTAPILYTHSTYKLYSIYMCTYTIYSSLFLDDDDAINRRVKKVLKEGLNPILCIGETKEEYDAGLAYDVCIYSVCIYYVWCMHM